MNRAALLLFVRGPAFVDAPAADVDAAELEHGFSDAQIETASPAADVLEELLEHDAGDAFAPTTEPVPEYNGGIGGGVNQ